MSDDEILKKIAELKTSCNKLGISIRKDYKAAVKDNDEKKKEEVVEALIALVKGLTEGMAILRNYVLTVSRVNKKGSRKELEKLCELGDDLVNATDRLVGTEDED